MCTDENNKCGGRFYLFYKFRTSKDLEILRQSCYMSHILKGLSKSKMHIPHIALFDEDKWYKRCSNAYFGGFGVEDISGE